MLKTGMNTKKKRFKYRKGDNLRNCGNCYNLVDNFQVRRIGGDPHKLSCRCSVIGLENSKRYEINKAYVCDAHKPKGNLAEVGAAL